MDNLIKGYIFLYDNPTAGLTEFNINEYGEGFPEIYGHTIYPSNCLGTGEDNLMDIYNEYSSLDGFVKKYIVGPLYDKHDYQLLVTGKEIKGVDADRDAIDREVSEEISLYSDKVLNYNGDRYYGYSINVNMLKNNPDYINNIIYRPDVSDITAINIERRDPNAFKINAVIYGSLNKFKQLYNKYTVINRPRRAEVDIIGVVIIPVAIIKSIITHI